ncbi:MAG: C25 family cysteine peptidase [Promethearchaeota archaeon]
MVRLSTKKIIYFSIIIFAFIPLIHINQNVNPLNYTNNSLYEKIKISNGDLELNLTVLPKINYSSLNNLWYDPKIEMLIITPNNSDFINAVTPLMEWKNQKGVKTIILSNFSLYEGRDSAEKIRNMIKEYYEKENIRWVLLAGDAQDNLIPIRKVYNPDVLRWGDGRSETVDGEEYKPTDYYYADLTGTWDNDDDSIWGEAPQDNTYGLDEISWTPEVYVGRLPADDAYQLEIMVNKTLKYETDPVVGDWMNRMLLAGGISDYPTSEDPDGEYESRLTGYIIENYAADVLNYTQLVGEAGNLTQSALSNYFNDGYSTVLMAGHGIPTAYYRTPSSPGYTSLNAINSLNKNMPSLIYLDACSTSSYDYNDNSVGETLIRKENGGAIGAIGGLRVTWYLENDEDLEKLNRGNAKLFWREFFVNKKFQQGMALYDSKVAYINSDYYNRGEASTDLDFERKNILTYCLLGDPELDVYTNKPKVASNPFTGNIYEGQLISVILKDINNNIIPYGRIHLESSDGKYFTAYADKDGLISFRLPAQSNESYNVIITGHNLVPTHFNFTTLSDRTNPQLSRIDITPKNPSTSNQITFNIETYDNNSGVESVYLLISKNNFTTFSYYDSINNYEYDKELFKITIERLNSGDYSYCIISRDYANNSNIFYNSEFNFYISESFTKSLLIAFSFLIVAAIGFSIFIFLKSVLKYSRIVKEIEGVV